MNIFYFIAFLSQGSQWQCESKLNTKGYTNEMFFIENRENETVALKLIQVTYQIILNMILYLKDRTIWCTFVKDNLIGTACLSSKCFENDL